MNWINIKDKLPEFGKEVLIAMSHRDLAGRVEPFGFSYDVDFYCCTKGWYKKRTANETVAFWMELPEDPQDNYVKKCKEGRAID